MSDPQQLQHQDQHQDQDQQQQEEQTALSAHNDIIHDSSSNSNSACQSPVNDLSNSNSNIEVTGVAPFSPSNNPSDVYNSVNSPSNSLTNISELTSPHSNSPSISSISHIPIPAPLPRPNKASVTAALANSNIMTNNSAVDKVLSELYSSEFTYLTYLSQLVQAYIQPITDRVNTRHTEKLLPFFQLIRSVHTFHSAFLIERPVHSGLNSANSMAINHVNSNLSIAAIFQRYFPYLQLYTQYAAVFQQSLNQLKSKTKASKKLKSIIIRKDNPNGEEFYNLLRIITQRPQIYYDFIAEIVSCYDDNPTIRAEFRPVVENLAVLARDVHEYWQKNTELDIEALNQHAKDALKLTRQISPPVTPNSIKQKGSLLGYPDIANANLLGSTDINEQIFRYVPRTVLERFILAQEQQIRYKINSNLHNLLPQHAESYSFKHAALLVADVSGFTKLNEALKEEETKQRGAQGKGAESLTLHLNKYFTNLLNIIENHGGDCVKFAGDALIVVFLPPNSWHSAGSGEEENTADCHSKSKSKNTDNDIEKELFAQENEHSGALEQDLPSNDPAVLSRPNSLSQLPLSTTSLPSEQPPPSRKFRFSRLSSNFDREKSKEITTETCLRAVQCALQLQSDVGLYTADPGGGATPIQLSLHIAVSSGSLYGYHVGGYKSEWEFLLTGTAFKHIGKCIEMSKTGEVLVTKKTWDLIAALCEATPVTKNFIKTGDWKINRIVKSTQKHSLPALSFSDLAQNHAQIATAMRSYVPRAVLDMLDARRENWLAEIRTITVIFVNLRGLVLNKHDSDEQNDKNLKQTQGILFELQRIIHRNEGYRRQFLLDDKGSTLIVVFGVTPYAHEDDAYRSIKTVFEMREKLLKEGCTASYGIATGTVYVGSVGSLSRQEHAVVGDTVNTAARLSGRADDDSILMEHTTYEKVKLQVSVKQEGEILVKGKKQKLKIYSAIKFDRLNVMQSSAKGMGETMSRNQETAIFMHSLVDLQQNNESSVIFVEGDPGIGKTHLIRNFYGIAKTNNDINVYYAKADATEQNTSLSCWTPILEGLLKLTPPANNSSAVNKRSKQFIKYIKNMLEAGQALNDPRLPFINCILSEPINIKDTYLSKQLKGQHKAILQQAQQLVVWLLSNAVTQARAKNKFTVMFVEDLHLLDTASMQVLIKLAEECRPMLLVMTARPPSSGNSAAGAPSASKAVSTATSRAHSRRNSFSPLGHENNIEINEAMGSIDHSRIEIAESKEEIEPPPVNRAASGTVSIERSATPSISSSSAPSTSNSTGSVALTGKLWNDTYPVLKKLPGLRCISLEGLNNMTCTRLVCQRLHAMSIEYNLAQIIMKRSRGNPLYATEVASHLLDKGYITINKEGHCHLAEGKSADEASLDLPNSLKGLVVKRIDSLPINELLVCKLASVFGYEDFSIATFAEMCRTEGLDAEQMKAAVINLVNHGILAKRETHKERQEREQKERAAALNGEELPQYSFNNPTDFSNSSYYYFSHELVHSACYEMLLFSQKLRLHKLLAELEQRSRHEGQPNKMILPFEEPSSSISKAIMTITEETDVELRNSHTSPPRHTVTDDFAMNSANLNGHSAKRRLSVLSFHYSMAVQSYSGTDHSENNEMRSFIAQAKEHLAKNTAEIPQVGHNHNNKAKESEQKIENSTFSVNSAAAGPEIPLCSSRPIPLAQQISSALSQITSRGRKSSTSAKSGTSKAKFSGILHDSGTVSGPGTPRTSGNLSPALTPSDISPLPSAVSSTLSDNPYPDDYLLQCSYAAFQLICAKIKMSLNMKEKLLKLLVNETRNAQRVAIPAQVSSRRNTVTSLGEASALHNRRASQSGLKAGNLLSKEQQRSTASPGKQRNNSVSGASNITSQNNGVTLSFTTATAMMNADNAEKAAHGVNQGYHNSVTQKQPRHTRKHSRQISTSANLPNSSQSSATSAPKIDNPQSAGPSFSSFFFKRGVSSAPSGNPGPATVGVAQNSAPVAISGRPGGARFLANSIEINNKVTSCVEAIIKLSRADILALKQLKQPKPLLKQALEAFALLVDALIHSNGTEEAKTSEIPTDSAPDSTNIEELYERAMKLFDTSRNLLQFTKLATQTARERSVLLPNSLLTKLQPYLSNSQLAQHRVNSANLVVGTLWSWVKAVVAKSQLGNQPAPNAPSNLRVETVRRRSDSASNSSNNSAGASPVPGNSSTRSISKPNHARKASRGKVSAGHSGNLARKGGINGVSANSTVNNSVVASPRSSTARRKNSRTSAQ
jgi:class 3 adenylate cyclase